MALILAIESDRRQVNHLTAMVRGRLRAELVLGDTAEAALDRLGDRVPDLILTSPLLSPRDEQALSDRLRKLNGVAAHVQTLTLPLFAPPGGAAAPARGGMLSALLGDRGSEGATTGCDPAVFAEQCREYLQRSEAEREANRDEQPVQVQAQEDVPEQVQEWVQEVPEAPNVPAVPAVPRAGSILHLTDDPTSILAAVAAVEPEPLQEPPEEEESEFVDVDLSELLEVEAIEATIVEDDEPAVYELSASDATELEAASEPSEPAEDFEEWQQVVDSLKRESRRIQLPRTREPEPKTPMVRAGSPANEDQVAEDEFGMYDPKLAGMAALFAKIGQLSEEDDPPAPPKRPRRV